MGGSYGRWVFSYWRVTPVVPEKEKERARVWVSRPYGHLKTQGYEGANGDSLKPRKYIHFGVVASVDALTA
jgi:hypothetical protein